MYETDDPRARMQQRADATNASRPAFAPAGYLKFHERAPDESAPYVNTWYGRGQNFVSPFRVRGRAPARTPSSWIVPAARRNAGAGALVTARRNPGVPGYSLVSAAGAGRIELRQPTRPLRVFPHACDVTLRASDAKLFAAAIRTSRPSRRGRIRRGAFASAPRLDVPPQPGRFGGASSFTT